jgi:hypothetical protein
MTVRQLKRVTDVAGAVALAERLNGNGRRRPVVVITIPAGRSEPYIDAEEVLAQVGDLADVYLMPTGSHTWQFSEQMPEQTQVYGGAGRVYPVGHEWASNPYVSPLRFAYNEEEGERSTRALASDALRMAAAAGLIRSSTSRHRRRVEGRVEGIPVDERALVKFDGRLATVVQELTVPGVPLGQVLTVGMPVSGWFDNETQRLDIRESLRSPEESLTSYDVGDVVLAQVREVHEDRAVVLLHPEVPVTVTRDDVTANDLDDLRSLMTAGEVLPARVTAPGPDWQLTLLDVDDDEVPVTAASLLPGGPPWLEPPPPEEPASSWLEEPVRPALPTSGPTMPAAPVPAPTEEVTAPEPVPAPRPTPLLLDRSRGAGRGPATPAPAAPAPAAVPAPAAPTPAASPAPAAAPVRAEVAALRAEMASLEGRFRTLEADFHAVNTERAALVAMRQEQEGVINRLRRELQSQKAKLRKAKRPGPTAERIPEFADREQGFRHAVETAWALRTPVAEQEARPLGEYSIGPEFLDSLERTPGVSLPKVADVVFEIVTDRAHEIAGRDLHQLRASAGPTSEYVRRADGATLWRAALQVNTPQARRIHFWALPDGSHELVDVRLHDDL